MVYLHNTRERQEVFFPKSARFAEGRVTLSLLSLMENTTIKLDMTEEGYPVLQYHLSVELPELRDGEYEYTLSDCKGLLSQGILVVGCKEEMIEYDNTIEYEQYQ